MIDKKYIIPILIIILIIGGGLGLYITSQFQVGTTYFSLPEGYHAKTHNNGVVNLTNGKDSLILNEYSSNHTDEKFPLNYYKTTKEKQNVTVKLENFSVYNIKVYKASITNGTDIYHYWFSKDGKVYEIASYNGNQNTDELVTTLIKSMRSSII